MDNDTREIITRLAEYLAEAHSTDRDTMVEGTNHCGDGREGCSYCDAIDDATAMLATFTK
mgnify:CR=1